MRVLRLPFLLLSLFVSSAAFAAPPVITLLGDGSSISVSVPAGHRVAWNVFNRSAIATDGDGDGIVRIDWVEPTSWLVADVETGEWAQASPFSPTIPAEPAKAGKILVDPAGNSSLLVLAAGQNTYAGMWVRPGVGAWGSGSGTWPAAAFLTRGNGISILDATQLVPLGSSPAVPAGFRHGDLLMIPGSVGGVVDAALDAPPAAGTFSINRTGGSAAIEGTTINVDIIRYIGTAGTVTVDLSLVTTGMEAGVDFAPFPAQTLTFGPGEVVKKLVFQTLDDAIYTTYTRLPRFNLSNATGGAVIAGAGTSVFALTENDPPPAVTLGTTPESVVEGDADWSFTVPWSLDGSFRGTIGVGVSANGTYTSKTATPDDAAGIATVVITANDVPDPTREGVLRVTAVSSKAERKFAIIDDDPPSWTTTDITVRESDGVVLFPFTLTAKPGSVASLTFKTVDGLATAAQDYAAQTTTISIADATQYATLQIIDDAVADGNEMFFIDVVSTSGPVQPPTRTRFTVTIIDNDAEPPPVSLSMADSVIEGDGGGSPVPVIVRLASPATSDIFVTLRAGAGGTASASDFGVFSTPLLFLAGETEKTTAVSVAGDFTDEDIETAVIEAVSRSGVVVARKTFEIVDDDTLAYINVADISVEETDSEATFVITFSEAPGSSGSFEYETQDLYATAASDYVSKSGKIEFGPNDTRKEVRVPLVDDAIREGDETFLLKLANLDAKTGIYLHKNVSVVTIHDNEKETGPIITLAADAAIEGDAGQKSVPVFVRLAAVVLMPVEVAILTKQGTAGAGADYVPLSTSVSFLPGETEKQVWVDIIGDTLGEGDESLIVTATYEGAVAASMTLTIKDDDTIHYVSVSDTSVVEGTGASSTAVFRVMFLPPPPNGGTIHYKTEQDTANAGDYAGVSGTLTFKAGDGTLTIPVEVFGDATGERDERFRMRISDPTGGVLLFDDMGIATIYDDDGPIVRPTLTIDDVAVSETNE